MAGTVYASAVLVGARAVVIRGPSGSGKSRLAFDLIAAGRTGLLAFVRLVADDRVHLQAAGGRLLVRPAPALAGLIELRGVGIVQLLHEPCAVVGRIVDLGAADAERLPQPHSQVAEVAGIVLPRLAAATAVEALPGLLALYAAARDAMAGEPGGAISPHSA